MFSSYRGLPKETIYLVYAAILPSIAYGMFFTDISYFLTSVQGISYELMGLIITAIGISTFVACLFVGILGDVYGKKKMLIVGNILASAVLAVFALTTNPAILLSAAILEGIGEAAVLASSSALLTEKAQDAKRNAVFSLYGFIQSTFFGLGSIAIPAVVVFELLGFTNKEGHIILYISMAVLSLVSTVFLLKVQESTCLKKTDSGFTNLLPRKSKDVLFKSVLTGAIIAIGAGMVVPLMTAWFTLQYGIPDTLSGPILGISSLLIGVSTLSSPWLARKVGLVKAIVITQASSTLFMFLTPFSPSFALASIVYSARALLMNVASPLSQSLIMGLVAEDERCTASGLSGALWRLPSALSTFVGAWLMGMGLLTEPFVIASVSYFIAIMLFWQFFKNAKIPEEQKSASQ